LKSDTFTTLTHFFVWVSTQFRRLVRALLCDNGREFDNHAARSFFLTSGVQLRLSCPYTSAQNGRVERMIRTTTNMICCLLFQASLPASYWAEALHTATHLNRLPSKAVRHPTPYFALYGTDPSYDHLRMFDCACYPNTSATTPHKLSPRSTRCLFLGYSPNHKGYRCLDLASHRIIIFRHIVFDEDVFPLLTPPHPPISSPSLSLIQVPIFPQAPRLTPLSAPRAASPSSRAAPSTPLVPHAAPTPPLALLPAPRVTPSPAPAPRAAPATPGPSTSGTRFADPALIYRRRESTPPSTPTNPGPSTRAVHLADPAVVYHRRESATPVAPAVSAPHSEPSVYHPVAIHREPGHIHPMVTRRAAGVLHQSIG
jgi:hypothetical protein